MHRPGILTTYLDHQTTKLEKFSSFCLAPAITAFGRKVKVGVSYSYSLRKTTSLVKRIFIGFLAILLFPTTLLGLLLRASSRSHRQLVNEEKIMKIVCDAAKAELFENLFYQLDLKRISYAYITVLRQNACELLSKKIKNYSHELFPFKRLTAKLGEETAKKLCELSFLHGTQSSTLAAMCTSDRLLKPTGQLRKENEVSFYGINDVRSIMINENYISGTGLKQAHNAMKYASIQTRDEVLNPGNVIEEYYAELQEVLALTDLADLEDFIYTFDLILEKSVPLFNLQRIFKILQCLEPEMFEEKIISTVREIVEKINQNQAGDAEFKENLKLIKEKLFLPLLSLPKRNRFQSSDIAYIKNPYPMVFGSKVAKAFNIETEKVCRGALKLGEDLEFLFVNKKDVETTRNYLINKNIQNVTVVQFSFLLLASIK